jgi:hypothetical protein
MRGMRIFVVSLLLVNIAFFAWTRRPTTEATATTRVESAAPALSAPQQLSPLRCQTMGPFPNAEDLAVPAAALKVRGLSSRTRRTEKGVNNGWWVYVAGLTSPAQLRAAENRLRKAGIKDVAEISFSNGDDRISVGIFSEHDRALNAADIARASNLTPTIEERLKSSSEWWLDIDLKRELAPPTVAALLGASSTQRTAAWTDCSSFAAGG